MKKVLLTVAAVAGALFVNAQNIPNASFENVTGNDVDNWTLLSGKASAPANYSINTSQGTFTANPSNGSKLLVLANDTTGANPGSVFVGRMESRFAYNKMPARFYADLLYLTTINTETFAISIVMFRDSAGANDTVLNRYIFLQQPGAVISTPQGSNMPLVTLTSQLPPNAYMGTDNPDSCVITLITSGAWTQGNTGSTTINTTLLLDNLRFSNELTSVEGLVLPNHKALSNYPNPASSSTTIEFDMAMNSEVELSVFDLTGRKVYTQNLGQKEAGFHNVLFNTSMLNEGIYMYTIKTNHSTETSRMVIVK